MWIWNVVFCFTCFFLFMILLENKKTALKMYLYLHRSCIKLNAEHFSSTSFIISYFSNYVFRFSFRQLILYWSRLRICFSFWKTSIDWRRLFQCVCCNKFILLPLNLVWHIEGGDNSCFTGFISVIVLIKLSSFTLSSYRKQGDLDDAQKITAVCTYL